MKHFIIAAGARPNFMKIAPLCEQFDKAGIGYEIYNSGQHYDEMMNGVFCKQFSLKNIFNFSISCDNKIKDMQEIMCDFKGFLLDRKNIDGVIVVGDVDTTIACALVAKKLNLKLVHIEAGLRSFDHTMPEERNRITVDHISDLLFTTCHDAEHNLYEEGIEENVHMVGNLMIDCLIKFGPVIMDKLKRNARPVKPIVVTIHRPENVDTNNLYTIIKQLELLSYSNLVIFPMHPRVEKRIRELGLEHKLKECITLKPLGYIDFMAEVVGASVVITDSGGIQEETTYLGIPCLTIRKSTERPITITEGTNKLIKVDEIVDEVSKLKASNKGKPKFWDGHAAERITDVLQKEII